MKIRQTIYKQFNLPFKAVLVLALPLLFTGACKIPEDDKPDAKSGLNVVNAIIGSEPFTFSINRQKILGDPLTYTKESGYFITYAGSWPFGITYPESGDFAITTTINLQLNTYHTLFVGGEASSLTTLFTTDDLSAPPAGKAKIRFVQMSPDAGNLTLAVNDGSGLSFNQDFKTASEFMTIDPGTYTLELKRATGEPLYETEVTIADGKIYTAWSKGLFSGTGNSPIGLQFRSIN